jgi:hypothetical protein
VEGGVALVGELNALHAAVGGSARAGHEPGLLAARVSHGDIAHAAQTVFLVAAPLAALAAVVLLWLPQQELQGG